METGTLINISEFTVHDGPGVRATAFLKGCPLRCTWCHNPEGQRTQPELMVRTASCTGCGRCRAVCPSPEGCTACGVCTEVCPNGLRKIVGERLTSAELAGRLRKNAGFYTASGGGVTFSGGEPLMQPAFLFETLDRLSGIHRAVETSCCAAPEVFEALLSRVEYIFADLKIFDSAVHERYTGRTNKGILDNIRLLKRSGLPYCIRIPLIPGVNDTEENMEHTAAFLAEGGMGHLDRVELLPYNRAAAAKYPMLGRKYAPGFDTARTPRTAFAAFSKYAIRSVVL
ncbi:MAG: glycyl-radical enzyme activating protein [Candidatus Howiella sp.]